MTPEQKLLARHALGLPNKAMVSYRNRYLASLDGDSGARAHWSAMVFHGLAEHSVILDSERLCLFRLTRAGATLALEPGESLCKEDFPDD